VLHKALRWDAKALDHRLMPHVPTEDRAALLEMLSPAAVRGQRAEELQRLAAPFPDGAAKSAQQLGLRPRSLDSGCKTIIRSYQSSGKADAAALLALSGFEARAHAALPTRM